MYLTLCHLMTTYDENFLSWFPDQRDQRLDFILDAYEEQLNDPDDYDRLTDLFKEIGVAINTYKLGLMEKEAYEEILLEKAKAVAKIFEQNYYDGPPE